MTRTHAPLRPQMPAFTQRCHQRGPLALIEVFRDYGLIPDDRGEIPHLSREAAALIRSCGYPARAGQTFRCPLLPDEAVRGYPMFEHLSNADWIVRRWGRGPYDWHPKRAQLIPIRQIRPKEPISKTERRFLELIAKRPLSRRRLQQKLWDVPASMFNHILDNLIAIGLTTGRDGQLCLSCAGVNCLAHAENPSLDLALKRR